MTIASPRVSVAIPLFRSARFVDNVSANIEALPADVEILVSDRHGHDEAIDRLEQRHGSDRRLRFLRRFDAKNWPDHISDLFREARGDYWRLMPHDDFSGRPALEALVACLDENPETLLAYGPTTAVDLAGRHLPECDHRHPHPIGNDDPWRLGLILDSFSRGHFSGAFKGLWRRSEIVNRKLWIRQTRDTVYAERVWLSALGLVGRFRHVREAEYLKRFHPESTHAQWRPGAAHEWSAHRVFLSYCKDLVPNRKLYRRIRAYTTWTTLMRLGLVASPVELPTTEPFLPGGSSKQADRPWPTIIRRLRDDWRALHRHEHLNPP